MRADDPKWVLLSLSLSALLSALGTSIANVGLPTLANVFDASFQQVQWVVLSYLLAVTTSIVSVGRLGDLVGRRRLLLIGLATFSLAALACGMASSLWVLVAARAVQGVGAAMMMTLTLALVGERVPKEKTGSAMGVLGTVSAVGTALGPTVGGVLIAAFGWQAIFLAQVPLGLLAWVLAARALPADDARATSARARLDVVGTLTLAAMLSAYALAMTLGRGHFGMLNVLLLGAALLSAGLFVWGQSRAKSPLVPLAMFRAPQLGAGFAMSALVTTVVMATLVVGPFHLSRTLGLDAMQVGLVMSVGPIIAALVGVPGGRCVDRFGAGATTLAGLTSMLVGAIAIATAPVHFGAVGYVVPLAVLTAGYATFQAANNTGVMRNVAPDQRGVVSGLLNLSRNLGLVTGASVMGALFAWGGIKSAFLVAAGLLAVALVAALVGRVMTTQPNREAASA